MTSHDTAPAIGSPDGRITSIDVLRGVVILGILPMNIQFFAMGDAAFFNPLAGSWTGRTDVVIWTCLHVLLGMKDLSIFAMLFGAGIIMMEARSRERGQSTAAVHYKRMAVLLVFGLVHAYAIWYGDILYHYALAGSVVYVCRNLRCRTQIVLGALCYGVMLLILYSGAWLVPSLSEESAAQVYESFRPTVAQIQEFQSTYAGGWWQQMTARAPAALASQTLNFAGYMGWVSAGMMLVGMALFRLGVFEGRCPTRWYVMMIAAAVIIGLPMLLYGVYRNFSVNWDPRYSMYRGRMYSEFAAPFMALGWLSVVMLVWRSGRLQGLTRRLAAVGRMSMTNYVMQSVICALIFHGHGLGLVNQVDRVGQLGITGVVWLFQLAVSPLWLRRFSFGPLEWLWRSLTYGQSPRSVLHGLAFAGLALAVHFLAFLCVIFAEAFAAATHAEYLFELLTAVGVVAATWLCVRFLDGQSIEALGFGLGRGWARRFAWGMLAGLTLTGVAVTAGWVAGWARIQANPQPALGLAEIIGGMSFCILIAIHEELLCRGYLLQTIARWNRGVAVFLTGCLFLLIHWDNEGLWSPLSVLNLALAHLLYVAVYFRTRSLWALIGLHAMWNFTLAYLIGLPISGWTPKSSLLITTLPHGIWTGNEFGPEGGLIITLILAAASFGAWRLLKQRQPLEGLLNSGRPGNGS